jgi:sugar/nucleoside kinase (ribokinase family)
MVVCALGDLVLDVSVRLRQPLAAGADAASAITLGPGGQAANVAAWVAELGGTSRWIGVQADDDAGRLARAHLARFGVALHGPLVPRGGGVIVSLVDTDGGRTMCPDRGAAVELLPEDVDPAWLERCDWLHVSGYALFVEPVRSAAARAVEAARAAGARVSVDLASWSGIRDTGVDRFRTVLEALAPDAVFANEDESRILGPALPAAAWIRKHGAAGCSFDGEQRAALPVERVVDTTGAGDALAAGWLVGGPDLALAAAARCVQHVGAMPATPAG